MTGHEVTDADGRILVSTERRSAPRLDALAGYLALADRFGREQVYLLESAEGPECDTRYQVTGFGLLLTVSVTRGRIRVAGVPVLREVVLRRCAPLLEAAAAGSEDDGRLVDSGGLWRVLREVTAAFDAEGSAARFRFGFLGYFGYDTGRYIEELSWLIEPGAEPPDVHLALYQGCVVTDRATGDSELLVHQSAVWPRIEPDEIAGLLAAADPLPPTPDAAALPEFAVTGDTDRPEFLAKVERSLQYIAAGDIYQVQVGHELAVASTADPLQVYLRLRARNPSPYMYLADMAGHAVVGASPELFVRMEDGTVTMRPIAGTIPRGAGDDEEIARTLLADPKERAEHTMLVDLCRNDLGRVCRADAFEVPDRFVIQRYSHVLHLVSSVVGRAADGTDAFDVIAALFPAGTVTGTPKIRAMEIIEELEHTRRGLYAGALGLMDIGGYLNLALCIRTLIARDGVYRTRASAGVVADSVAEREWTETLAKMSATYWAVTGEELLSAAGSRDQRGGTPVPARTGETASGARGAPGSTGPCGR
jgi:anthranilate synthase component 1